MTTTRGRWLGLRARVIVAFALGALVVSVLLSAVTLFLARSHLFGEREQAAGHLAASFAAALEPGLAGGGDPARLVNALSIPADTTLLLDYQGNWLSSPPGAAPELLPEGFRERVMAGGSGRVRYRPIRSSTLVAAGATLPRKSGEVFVVIRLNQLDDALSAFTTTLVAVAAGTTLLAAVGGIQISRLIIRPVQDAAAAASAVARGELGTRLSETADRDLRVLAVSFNAMVDALNRRMARDARFSADVSHELRSPLTALSMSAQVLAARRDALPDRDRQALDVLVAQLGRFERLVEDLIEISRSGGEATLSLEDVDIGEFVIRAASTANPQLPVNIDPTAEHRRAMVEKRRLERVIANLIDNARFHGGGAVGLGVGVTGDRIHITVDDAGPGIPESDRERIFERFARGPTVQRGGSTGAGLGLALVHEHVRLHGGTVRVEERPGGGARFVVELPCLPPERVTH